MGESFIRLWANCDGIGRITTEKSPCWASDPTCAVSLRSSSVPRCRASYHADAFLQLARCAFCALPSFSELISSSAAFAIAGPPVSRRSFPSEVMTSVRTRETFFSLLHSWKRNARASMTKALCWGPPYQPARWIEVCGARLQSSHRA